jgi:hypothetical protein
VTTPMRRGADPSRPAYCRRRGPAHDQDESGMLAQGKSRPVNNRVPSGVDQRGSGGALCDRKTSRRDAFEDTLGGR